MKQHRRFRTIRATVVLMVIAGVAILIAPEALASAPSATATLTGGVTTAGVDGNFTFSVTPSSRTLASFTVTAPAGWLIDSTSAGTISSNGDAKIGKMIGEALATEQRMVDGALFRS